MFTIAKKIKYCLMSFNTAVLYISPSAMFTLITGPGDGQSTAYLLNRTPSPNTKDTENGETQRGQSYNVSTITVIILQMIVLKR